MSFIEDQQAPRTMVTQPFTHRVRVGRVDQQALRDQEPAVGTPGIHTEAAIPAHPRHVAPVEHLEHEAEPVLHLPLPLLQHRRRRGNDCDL